MGHGRGTPPGSQIGHRAEFQGRGPRSQPPGRPQYPDQLVVAQPVKAALPHVLGERGQLRPGWHGIGRAARGESGG